MNENAISLSKEEYNALMANRTRLNILIDFVEAMNSEYADVDILRVILGMDKREKE